MDQSIHMLLMLYIIFLGLSKHLLPLLSDKPEDCRSMD
jgi:hypothetical protein